MENTQIWPRLKLLQMVNEKLNLLSPEQVKAVHPSEESYELIQAIVDYCMTNGWTIQLGYTPPKDDTARYQVIGELCQPLPKIGDNKEWLESVAGPMSTATDVALLLVAKAATDI